MLLMIMILILTGDDVMSHLINIMIIMPCSGTLLSLHTSLDIAYKIFYSMNYMECSP